MSAGEDIQRLKRTLLRIDDPSARKIVIMSKWERGQLTNEEAHGLIVELGLEAA